MNSKWKLLTTSLLVVGALTACNTEKDTAMERRDDLQRVTSRADRYEMKDIMADKGYNPGRSMRVPSENPWDISNVGYSVDDSTRGHDGKTSAVAMRRHAANQLRATGDNDINNHLRNNDTSRSTNRNREITGTNGTGTYPGANVTNVGTNRSGAGATGTGTGMTGTGAGTARTSDRYTYSGTSSYPANIGTTRSDVMNGGVGTRDYDVNRVTNRTYDANRVTNREEKTDDFGNVKYSKINQRIKQARNDAANNTSYNDYGSGNYHGHLTNTGTGNVTTNDYNVDGSRATSQQIETRVKNLRDVDRVAAVTYGKDIVIAVKPRNAAATGTLESDVRRAAEPYAKGRDVHVTVTKTMYDRVRNMDNQMRTGSMTNDMNRDMTDLFRSLRADYNRVTD